MSVELTSESRVKTGTWLRIPSGEVIAVEHPCIVKNAEKAIDMIGGAPAVAQVLEEGSDKVFALSFRPQDPAARTILANKKQANNVLLKITVPKRTGRKRKRGSNDPWVEDVDVENAKKDATLLVHSMHDNPNHYALTALSSVSSMHLWRRMPDFVYSTSQTKLLHDVKSQILSQQYPLIKEFRLPQTHGLEDTTTLPPPVWSNAAIPHSYAYRQNPTVTVTSDPTTGKTVVHNTQKPPKIYSYQVQWDTPEYPRARMPGLAPLEEQSHIFQVTVAALQNLFEERPIWTRRALLNCLQSDLSSFNVVRYCLAYVAYAIRSGPFRDSYVCIGVDPRTDQKYRVYQTIMLQLVPKANRKGLEPIDGSKKIYNEKGGKIDQQAIDAPVAAEAENATAIPKKSEREKMLEERYTYARFWSRSNDTKSHIFDGKSPLPPDGKVWQLCDITDPQIVALRDISETQIRSVCEKRYFGWYHNGTNAKMRVALKAKVDSLMDGTSFDYTALEGFMKLPESISFDAGGPTVQDNDQPADATHATAPLAGSSTEQLNDVDELVTTAEELWKRASSLASYLGENPTKQQLEWASLYRSFARTNPGHKPITGGLGHTRLSNVRPVVRKSYRPRKAAAVGQDQQESENVTDGEPSERVNEGDPIEVDAEELEDADMHEEALEVDEGEQLMQSIEVNGFDVEDGDYSELGLNDDFDIKIEDDVHDTGILGQPSQGAEGPTQNQ